MKIALITAMDLNGLIGRDGDLPWGHENLKDDMKWFRDKTRRKPIIMGRETFDSLGRKPLPNRLNIVISKKLSIPRSLEYFCASNADGAIEIAEREAPEAEEVVVIGGAQMYELFWNKAKRIYLTGIDAIFAPYQKEDIFFPRPLEEISDNWPIEVGALIKQPADTNNKWPLTFAVLEKE